MAMEGDNNRQNLESKEEVEIKEKEEAIDDRISLLPDHILTDILSQLPLYSAVATSVLSHRWRYLWTQLTHLFFDTFNLKLESSSSCFNWSRYAAIVNRLLPHFTSRKIHSLRIETCFVEDYNVKECSSCLESWISAVCKRHVERMEVNINGGNPWVVPSVGFPSCVFQCQSLITLSLQGHFRFNDDDDDQLVVTLPKLNTLDIQFRVLDYKLMEKVLKSCSLLDQLSLRFQLCEGEGDHLLDLSPLCLKTLFIKTMRRHELPQVKCVINASKLEDITLHGLCLSFVRFVNPSGALRTADISFNYEVVMDLMDYQSHVMDYDSHAVEFANLMSSATDLQLDASALFALMVSMKDVRLLTMFDNLSCLNIVFNGFECDWNDLLEFLRCSPNLVTLNMILQKDITLGMNWVVLEEDYRTPPCGLSKLKTVNIEGLEGNDFDYKMMGYIMSNAKVLDLLSVELCVRADSEEYAIYELHLITLWKEYEFCEELFLLQSSSPTCKIQLSGQFLTVSSKGFEDGSHRCQSIRLGCYSRHPY